MEEQEQEQEQEQDGGWRMEDGGGAASRLHLRGYVRGERGKQACGEGEAHGEVYIGYWNCIRGNGRGLGRVVNRNYSSSCHILLLL